MTNRLADETSPYLRQHAENPVDWFPWGEEAFELARTTDRPVLLSVGYSSCHWCHVMAHESFEDEATARTMNEWFVNVKVDREERPDVDAVYMEATQAMTGRGGWPMTVFMTPDGEPFFCGTYFPPERRHGTPGFAELLAAVHDAWTSQREELLGQAERLAEHVRRPVPAAEGDEVPGVDVLDRAAEGLLAAYDESWGGFGRAPKFPQAMGIDHLLRHHLRTGSAASLDAAVGSLDAMAAGGIYDHLGGGFSRYSVDGQWLVPHFEKMLYDNALLARTYLHAWQITGEDRFLQVLTETVGYVLDTLSHPAGGRYSAEDADSLPTADAHHAEEGAFYTWTPAQVRDALAAAGHPELTEVALDWWGITEGGNFEGASIPSRLYHRADLARPREVETARRLLLAAREHRPRPGLDDKVLTEWNALFLASLAEAARATGRGDWLAEAEATAEFLVRHLRREDGRWLRSWQHEAGAKHLAYAADHGALVDGFLCLYEATGRLRWLDEATAAADALLALFWDPAGGVWTTGDDAETLVARPKDVSDNATPAANSHAAVNLLRLEAHTGVSHYGDRARQVVAAYGPLAGQHPLGFGHLLWALELAAVGATEVVVTGDRTDLVEVVTRAYRPTTVLAWGEAGRGPLWEGRDPTVGRAYVCRDFTCAAPVTTAEALAGQLG
ncbi:MAG: thioredoxin domain-containing protein [Actinomycetes bacterium]